jgi:outer membrane protein
MATCRVTESNWTIFMRPISLPLLVFSLVSGTANANELLRIYDLALKNDTVLEAAGFGRDAGSEVKPQALAALLPQIGAGYSKGRVHEETTPSNPLLRGSGGTSDYNTSNLSLTLNQTVFDLSAFQALSRSNDQVALAVASYRAAEQGLILRTAQAYFNVLSAADNLRSSLSQKKAVEQQLEQSQKRFEVGLSAITDVQEAQARDDLASAQIIADQQTLDSGKETLSEITGTPTTALAAMQEDFPLPSPDPVNVDSWVQNAEAGNYNVLIAGLNSQIAKKTVNIAWSKHLPTLGLQGQYSDGDRGGFNGAQQTQTSIGATVSLPIFSGGATQSVIRQADYTYQQSLAQLEGTKRSTQTQTRNSFQGVLAGASRVKALKQAVLSSTTALDASQMGLQVGARTSIDVLNAQQQLYSAQRDYLKSRYDYLLNVLNLKSAAGRLTVQDLAEIDRLLVAESATSTPAATATP